MFFFCKLCEKWSHINIKSDENGVLEGSRGGLGSSCGALGAQDGTIFDFSRFCVTFSWIYSSIFGGFCLPGTCLGGHLGALKSIAEKHMKKHRFFGIFCILDPLKLWIIYRRGIKNSKIAHSRKSWKNFSKSLQNELPNPPEININQHKNKARKSIGK